MPTLEGTGGQWAKMYDYDAFLSYDSKDKDTIHALAERLKKDGLRVWLDTWIIKPGDSIPLMIGHGLERSRVLLMCMSPAYFESEWGKLEYSSLLFRYPTNAERRFIPFLIEDCKRPDIIAHFAYIDWREQSDASYKKLLAVCREANVEEAKPVAEEKKSSVCHKQRVDIDEEKLDKIGIFDNLSTLIQEFFKGFRYLKKDNNFVRNNHPPDKEPDLCYANFNPNDVTQKEHQGIGFNIFDATNILNQSGEFYSKKFHKSKDEESWIFMRSCLMVGKEIMIEISVTVRFDTNDIIFVMPMYNDGSEGLEGDKLESFYNLIHHFNSRINGGCFTKYTYDDSYAPVFMTHLPLSRMDFDWFKCTLNYFINIFIAFRPLFDNAITDFELAFKKNAALVDPVKNQITKASQTYRRFD
jgi:hypothetical protein